MLQLWASYCRRNIKIFSFFLPTIYIFFLLFFFFFVFLLFQAQPYTGQLPETCGAKLKGSKLHQVRKNIFFLRLFEIVSGLLIAQDQTEQNNDGLSNI